MKRVAIVINTSWNIYNFRLNLIKRLQQEGYEVVALAPRDAYSKRLEEEGVRFVEIPMQGSKANPLQEVRIFYLLVKAYRQLKPNITLHYTIKPNIYGTVAAWLTGTPSINNVSGLGTAFLNNGLVAKVARRLYKTAFQFPTKVFFQNPDDQRLFLKFGLVKADQSEVIPGSGIDTSRFQPNGVQENKTFSFLMISRLLYDKGVVEYVEAARALKKKNVNAKFQLLGAPDFGHRRGVPEKLFNRWLAEGDIEYLGVTDNVQPFIHKADCVVLPSYREGTPRTLLEAASCGKPLVATDVPGCNHVVVEGENGFLCKPKDVQSLREELEKMANLPAEQRLKFGILSRKIAESQFDERIVIDRYLSEISRLERTK